MQPISTTEFAALLEITEGSVCIKERDFCHADLSEMDLSDVHLHDCICEGVDFRGADLTDFEALGCNFHGARFNEAKLCRAWFGNCNFTGADFTGVSAEDVSLKGLIELKDSIASENVFRPDVEEEENKEPESPAAGALQTFNGDDDRRPSETVL